MHQGGKWVAEIWQPHKGKRLWLGAFSTAIEAAHAYDKAARAMHGPHAHVNFPNVSSSQATPGSSEFFGTSNKSEDCVGEVMMKPPSNNVETPNVCSSHATPGSLEFFGKSNILEDCVGKVGVKPVFSNNMEIPNVSSSQETPRSSEFFGTSIKLEDCVEVVVKPVANNVENEVAVHPGKLDLGREHG